MNKFRLMQTRSLFALQRNLPKSAFLFMTGPSVKTANYLVKVCSLFSLLGDESTMSMCFGPDSYGHSSQAESQSLAPASARFKPEPLARAPLNPPPVQSVPSRGGRAPQPLAAPEEDEYIQQGSQAAQQQMRPASAQPLLSQSRGRNAAWVKVALSL